MFEFFRSFRSPFGYTSMPPDEQDPSLQSPRSGRLSPVEQFMGLARRVAGSPTAAARRVGERIDQSRARSRSAWLCAMLIAFISVLSDTAMNMQEAIEAAANLALSMHGAFVYITVFSTAALLQAMVLEAKDTYEKIADNGWDVLYLPLEKLQEIYQQRHNASYQRRPWAFAKRMLRRLWGWLFAAARGLFSGVTAGYELKKLLVGLYPGIHHMALGGIVTVTGALEFFCFQSMEGKEMVEWAEGEHVSVKEAGWWPTLAGRANNLIAGFGIAVMNYLAFYELCLLVMPVAWAVGLASMAGLSVWATGQALSGRYSIEFYQHVFSGSMWRTVSNRWQSWVYKEDQCQWTSVLVLTGLALASLWLASAYASLTAGNAMKAAIDMGLSNSGQTMTYIVVWPFAIIQNIAMVGTRLFEFFGYLDVGDDPDLGGSAVLLQQLPCGGKHGTPGEQPSTQSVPGASPEETQNGQGSLPSLPSDGESSKTMSPEDVVVASVTFLDDRRKSKASRLQRPDGRIGRHCCLPRHLNPVRSNHRLSAS